MTKKRHNENPSKAKRLQQRSYNIEGLWYFELRGGGQHGPYDTKQEMENALNEFIALHHEMQQRDGL